MLFDLRGRGRRRAVRIIYASLAILMGGGLVFFGIGGATSGGLVDALNSGGGGGSGSDTFQQRVEDAEKAALARPRDPRPRATLAKAHYQLAGVGENYNQDLGQFTAKGQAELRQSARAWERYLALKPSRIDDNLAVLMVNAYISLSKPDQAVAAQEIVVEAQDESTGQFSKLAQLAYAAGQTRKADLAADKAVALAPKDQREIVKEALSEAKTQGPAALSQQSAPQG